MQVEQIPIDFTAPPPARENRNRNRCQVSGDTEIPGAAARLIAVLGRNRATELTLSLIDLLAKDAA